MKKYILILSFTALYAQLSAQENFVQTGIASIIGDKFVGRYTANGEKYSHDELTAAHLTLPFETKLKVTHLDNNQSVIVRVNDRGPFVENRIIDLSKSAAREIGFTDGTATVKIEVVSDKEVINTAETPKPVDVKKDETTAGVYFQVTSKTIKPTGFGVQIASYREPSNLLRLASEVETSSGFKPIIQVADTEDGKIFRMIVGSFDKRSEAEAVQQKMKTDYPQCYVIGL